MFILSGLIGALIGASVTAMFHIWKLSRDELSARGDELCRSLAEASAIASEYWAIDFAKEDQIRARVMEARIYGAQSMVDNLWASWKGRILAADSEIIDIALSDLEGALTGGQFSEAGRPSDPSRVRACPYLAAKLVVHIRDAHRRTIPFSRMSHNYWIERGSNIGPR